MDCVEKGHPWPTVKVSIFPQLQHPMACTIASYLASTMGRGKIGADRLVLERQSTVCDDTRPLQKGAWYFGEIDDSTVGWHGGGSILQGEADGGDNRNHYSDN